MDNRQYHIDPSGHSPLSILHSKGRCSAILYPVALWSIRVLEPLLFLFLLNRRLDDRPAERSGDINFLIICAITLFFSTVFGLSYLITLLILLLLYEIQSLFYRSGPIRHRFYLPLFFQMGCLLLHLFLPYLLQALGGSFSRDALSPQAFLLLIWEAVAMLLLVYPFSLRRQQLHLWPSYLKTLSTLLLLGLFSAATLIITRPHPFIGGLSDLSALLLLFCIPCLLFFADRSLQAEQQVVNLQNSTVSASEEDRYLDNLVANYQALRILKHDIKNTLIALWGYAEAQEHEKLHQLLTELISASAPLQQILMTGEPLIDALVTVKAQQAKALGADLRLSIVMPEQLPLSDKDLSSIIGNIFDNALEAISRVPKERRFLYFFTRQIGSTWQIEAVNSYDSYLRRLGHRLASRKNEPGHGLGLSQIEQLAEKYKGYSLIDTNADVFSIAVYLPLELPQE